MTMTELLNQYNANLLEAMQAQTMAINALLLRCDCCPLREACRTASEQGDELTCGEFIRSLICDGNEYRA